MIALLVGDIINLDETHCSFIIKAGAVGYEVKTNRPTLAQLTANQTRTIYTYTQVTETILALFGFLNQPDLRLFKLLLTVSGVGPKAAMNIMSLSSDQLVAALKNADLTRLTSIKGVGNKLGERLIIELKDKLAGEGEELLDTAPVGKASQEAVDALVSLGYSSREAKIVIAKLPPGLESPEEIVRAALTGK